MTDQEHAYGIRRAAEFLQEQITEARKAGLTVEIEMAHQDAMLQPRFTYFNVKISRTISPEHP